MNNEDPISRDIKRLIDRTDNEIIAFKKLLEKINEKRMDKYHLKKNTNVKE